MTSATDDLRLAADFPAASREDWRKLVDGVLKGAPFDKLVGRTYDGLRIEPIYQRARDAAPIAGRAAAAPWQIMQRIDHPDAADANAQALHDLENGATGLTLAFAGANGARGFGLEPTANAIDKLLDGVFLDAGIAIELQSARNPAWPRSTSPTMSSARASRPRPAISASASIPSAPARCGDPAPIRGTKSFPRSPARSSALPRRVQGPIRGCRWPGRSMTPADRKRRNWHSCWRQASPICARWRVQASRSKMRAAWFMRGSAPMPTSS